MTWRNSRDGKKASILQSTSSFSSGRMKRVKEEMTRRDKRDEKKINIVRTSRDLRERRKIQELKRGVRQLEDEDPQSGFLSRYSIV
jgi:hypothetical protein